MLFGSFMSLYIQQDIIFTRKPNADKVLPFFDGIRCGLWILLIMSIMNNISMKLLVLWINSIGMVILMWIADRDHKKLWNNIAWIIFFTLLVSDMLRSNY